MSEHYYSARPTAASERKRIEVNLAGHDMLFYTDTAVFSKNAIDFGTRLLIETMRLPNEGHILDIGCGYGPIGLTAAKISPRAHVTMVDVNERALQLARDNASLNHLNNVSIYESDRYEALGDRKFDCILTNPPIRAGKKIVHSILEGASEHLLENGALWVVIQKKQGAPSALTKLESCFPFVQVIAKKKGYFIIQASQSPQT